MADINVSTSSGASSDLFRLLVESVAAHAIFLLDPTGKVASWNPGAHRIKGYLPEEIVGKHFSIFYSPHDVKRGKPEYGLRTAAEEGRWEEEGWRMRKDGSRFWAHVTLTDLRDSTGRLVGFAKVTRDLTERKQAEEERSELLHREHEARVQVETALERLGVVQSVTEAALAHLGLDDLLTALLARIREALSVDTAAVLVLEGQELVARAAVGLEEEVEQGVRVPLGQGFAGRVAAERRAVFLEDVEHADVMRSGLGLGLYITRQIVEQHGGSIAVSFPDDGGTRLEVRLPTAGFEPRGQTTDDEVETPSTAPHRQQAPAAHLETGLSSS